MSQDARKPPFIAAGKVRVFYVFPKKLAKQVAQVALDEGVRPSLVAARLVARGLAAEKQDRQRPTEN